MAPTRPRSFPSKQDVINIDVRDYLIDRCVTDTDRTTTAADNDVEYDDIDGDATIDPGERAKKLPIVIPSQRFSDSELVRRNNPPTGSATFPGRSSSTQAGADLRVKRHRWKLLRKALNIFSSDEPHAASDDDGDDARTGRSRCVAAATDDDDEAGSGTDHNAEEPQRRLEVRSVSVESLPG